MGRQEIELARQTYDAFNRGDVDGALRRIDPAIECRIDDRFVRTDRVFHGHSGIREIWGMFSEALEEFRTEPEQLHDEGATVIAEVTASGFVRGTREPEAFEAVQVWRFREGRAVRVDSYPTLEEARAATAMTPPPASSSSMSDPV
jgi:ketosteroid isomerase-like protein